MGKAVGKTDQPVFYVSTAGTVGVGKLPWSSLADDRLARAKMLANAAPPADCGFAIPVAPARGPVAVHRPVIAYMTADGEVERQDYRPGAAAARVVGPLEEMELAARSRGNGVAFTPSHHATACEYEALWHKVNGGGVKCSNLEASGGGGGLSVTDEMLGSAQRLRWMDERIATLRDGSRRIVLAPVGWLAQPGRLSIDAPLLVHWSLIRRKPLARLLESRGWARQSRHLKTLKLGLIASLDAIYGL